MEAGITGLLRTRRFMPFFIAQFLGAFNDNVFRQGVILVIALAATEAREANTLNNLGLVLFILPFFLFSALAGQLADRFPKDMLLRRVKLAEVFVMLAGGAALYFNAVIPLLLILFLMGAQSAFFGPIKYSLIPQHLGPKELMAGNALVELGTFLAILLGSVAGVVLKMQGASAWLAPVAVVVLALAGWLAARAVPPAPAVAPDLRLDFNLWRESLRILGHARENPVVWVCVLGISWFWFLGAAYTTQLKAFVDHYLHGTEGVYALLLAMFSIGIGAGSILCERLSARRVQPGLIPLGAVGMSLAGLDMFFAWRPLADAGVLDVAAFIAVPAAWHVMADLLAIGAAGGFYIVPLFALVQQRGARERLSRIVAANNILNALFMVGAAIAGMVAIGAFDVPIPVFLLALGAGNLVVLAWMCRRVPEITRRLRTLWLLARQGGAEVHGLEDVPQHGPCLVIGPTVRALCVLEAQLWRPAVMLAVDENDAEASAVRIRALLGSDTLVCVTATGPLPAPWREAATRCNATLIVLEHDHVSGRMALARAAQGM